MKTLPLFPTSVVGSMPRPAWVRELINGDSGIDESDYRRRMDSAIRSVIALQETAGLDVLTDGEWGRKSYIGVIAELASGFELSVNEDGRPWTVVVADSERRCEYVALSANNVCDITVRQSATAVRRPLPSLPIPLGWAWAAFFSGLESFRALP